MLEIASFLQGLESPQANMQKQGKSKNFSPKFGGCQSLCNSSGASREMTACHTLTFHTLLHLWLGVGPTEQISPAERNKWEDDSRAKPDENYSETGT